MSEEKNKKKKKSSGGGGGGIDLSGLEGIGIVIGIIIAIIIAPIFIIIAISNSSSSEKESSSSDNDLKPLAKFTVSDNDINKGDTVDFEFKGETGDQPEKYKWNFGDDSDHSEEQNPSHQYNHAGNYTVELTVTDEDGDEDSATKDITVKESSNSSDSSDSSNHRIPVYDPYYFILTFIVLTALSFVIIKRKIFNTKTS